MSYLFVHVTSPTPSPTTLCTVTKRFAYEHRQKLNLCITITTKGRDSVVKPTGYVCTFSHVTIA